MQNRVKIFETISSAAKSNNHSNPSTSKGCLTTEKINEDNFEWRAALLNECDNLFDDLEVQDEELGVVAEKKLIEPELSTPQFKTAKNVKIPVPCVKSKVSAHFISKPPVTVSFKKSQNQPPPLKKRKIEQDKTNTNGQILTSLNQKENLNDSISDVDKNSSIKYINCIFHGNIINNFYSQKDSDDMDNRKRGN